MALKENRVVKEIKLLRRKTVECAKTPSPIFLHTPAENSLIYSFLE
jgi:hypothetical protein